MLLLPNYGILLVFLSVNFRKKSTFYFFLFFLFHLRKLFDITLMNYFYFAFHTINKINQLL
jgi:hypothetical protein